MADPLKNPARWSAYCYTFASGKKADVRGAEVLWYDAEDGVHFTDDSFRKDPDFLPTAIFSRLKGQDNSGKGWVNYPSYLDAIAAANDAARLAIADGAWKPEAA